MPTATLNIESKEQLIKPFFDGCKPKQCIGLEIERLCVDKNQRAVPYKTVKKLLIHYNELFGGEFMLEGNNPIGMIFDEYSITLEPGAQLEISLKPYDNINSIMNVLNKAFYQLDLVAEKFEISFMTRGIHPFSTNENIDLIPKKRYNFMNDYLSKKASRPRVMMRESAALQLSFDFSSEADMAKKLKTSLKMSPFISALFANSPTRDGKDTGMKSYRTFCWLHTDNERSGLISKKAFGDNFTFENYVDVLFNIPMIFVQRGNSYHDMKGLLFKDYLKNGFNGLTATIEDWELHNNLYFPDIRLRNYIEFRNIDSCPIEFMAGATVLLKNIMYNQQTLDKVANLLDEFNYEDIQFIKENVPQNGYHLKIRDRDAKFYLQEIIKLSHEGAKTEDKEFFNPLIRLVEKDNYIYENF